MHSDTPPKKPSGNHPSVVEHDQLASTKKVWKLVEDTIPKLARIATQGQQAGRVAPF